jgi:RNA polymerase-binding transcription factor DksA
MPHGALPAETAVAPAVGGNITADGAAENDGEAAAPLDLDAIERDLNDVQVALDRLNDGTYWTDELTGEPLADDLLTTHPTARTAAGSGSGSGSGN